MLFNSFSSSTKLSFQDEILATLSDSKVSILILYEVDRTPVNSHSLFPIDLSNSSTKDCNDFADSPAFRLLDTYLSIPLTSVKILARSAGFRSGKLLKSLPNITAH